MNRYMGYLAAILVVLSLGACSGGGDKPSDTTATAEPTEEIALDKTDKLAMDLIEAFKQAGLPIGRAVNISAENDSNQLLGRPGQYTAKWKFEDSRISTVAPVATYVDLVEAITVDQGGSIEVFANDADAKRRADYVQSITTSVAFLSEYSWQVENVFLRVGKALTPTQAAEYERILKATLN
jgi:hypothetical protein